MAGELSSTPIACLSCGRRLNVYENPLPMGTQYKLLLMARYTPESALQRLKLQPPIVAAALLQSDIPSFLDDEIQMLMGYEQLLEEEINKTELLPSSDDYFIKAEGRALDDLGIVNCPVCRGTFMSKPRVFIAKPYTDKEKRHKYNLAMEGMVKGKVKLFHAN